MFSNDQSHNNFTSIPQPTYIFGKLFDICILPILMISFLNYDLNLYYAHTSDHIYLHVCDFFS